eukprot:3650781-Rhodomonas_salina.2
MKRPDERGIGHATMGKRPIETTSGAGEGDGAGAGTRGEDGCEGEGRAAKHSRSTQDEGGGGSETLRRRYEQWLREFGVWWAEDIVRIRSPDCELGPRDRVPAILRDGWGLMSADKKIKRDTVICKVFSPCAFAVRCSMLISVIPLPGAEARLLRGRPHGGCPQGLPTGDGAAPVEGARKGRTV